jgi:hypothetical protein
MSTALMEERPAAVLVEPGTPGDPDYEDLGPAFPAWTGPDKDAILQPPKPQIRPSPRILERAMDRDPDLEAAE